MALIKKIIMENGFEGEYFKITSISLNKQTLIVDAALGLYKSKAFADKPNLRPEKIVNVRFKIQKEKAGDDLVKLAYEHIHAVLDGSVNPSQFDPGKLIEAQLQGAVSDEVAPQ